MTAFPISRPGVSLPERPAGKPRDLRLDVFRGVAMLLIVIGHTPNNPWWLYLPQRFGFSDAASIFVFCSGIASALAFGGLFARAGWLLASLRLLPRLWTVYWVHVGLFVFIASLMVALDQMTGSHAALGSGQYVNSLNLAPFFRDPAENLLGLLTLTYVPNYFDILPMYLVILALIPAAMALARIDTGLVFLVSFAVWLAANFGHLPLPAEPWSDRTWFFNPFGWQLLFFIGFGVAMGWLKPPAPSHGRLVFAAFFVAGLAPFAFDGELHRAIPLLGSVGDVLAGAARKTPHGPLRTLHFLALAYLAWGLLGTKGARLTAGPEAWRTGVAITAIIGRHSLAVFAFGMVLSRLLGAALDLFGRGPLATAAVNLTGLGLVVAVALLLEWLKTEPWKAAARWARLEAAADPRNESGNETGFALEDDAAIVTSVTASAAPSSDDAPVVVLPVAVAVEPAAAAQPA